MYRIVRARALIDRLQIIILIHIIWLFDRYAVRISMIVGRMIFSIEVDLSFVRNLSHINWRLKLIKLNLLQLHMRLLLVK